MFYDDDFVLALPADFVEASSSVLARYTTLQGRQRHVTEANELAFETHDLLTVLAERSEAALPNEFAAIRRSGPNAFEAYKDQFMNLARIFNAELVDRRSKQDSERFRRLLGQEFSYELSKADIDRIQVLINEARDLIVAIKGMDEDHKRRVLDRLEALQSELHRRVSNLDRLYGLIGDAGVMLGKFGHDAKPFVDRIREILQIAWRSQASAEGLPASAKQGLIAPPDTEHSEER